MADLSTSFMGLNLRNPVLVASSGLSSTVDGVRRCADAGAGAVVLKSLFEEQIGVETHILEEQSWLSGHPEAFEYVHGMGMELGPRQYLRLVEEAKKAVSIPVIGSLNCISHKWWEDYAKQISHAGADALELNISMMPSDPNRRSEEIERQHFNILDEVRSHVEIPVAVKIAPYFTSMSGIVNELARRGASALVLFNRFYQFDIDIEKLVTAPGYRFSSPEEIHLSLRWISLLAGRVNCELAANTGVHDGTGVIKHLLAGAAVVQLCSALYIHGMKRIGVVLKDLEDWMNKYGFASIDEIRGKLSQSVSDRPELYERLQYIKALTGIQ